MSDAQLPPNPTDAAGPGDGIPQGRLTRAAPLLGLATRTAGEAVAAGLRGRLTGAQGVEFHTRTAERYAQLLGRSRGALMKAGQMLSFTATNPAVATEFQSIYHTALSRLRADAPPMEGELARAVLEHELGQRAESVFAEFQWEPLAAASIGQVHAARLHNGREVAVKVQFPGVANAIRSDLKNAELLATFLSLTVGGISPLKLSFDFRGMAREMSARIAEELDYRLEAANQAEFADIYRGHPFIHVPDVVSELCTERVLTQELVRGRCWSAALTAEQGLRDRWAEAVFRFTYGSNSRFCLVHADPHPGNYLFHEDGSVSFLDFGCVKRFRQEQIDAMGAIGNECVHGDVLGTWRAVVESEFLQSSAPVTPEDAFAYWRGLLEMFWGDQPFKLTPEHATRFAANAFSPRGPAANALRHSTPSPEYTVMTRTEVGVVSVIAHLQACNYWESMAAEYFEAAEPFTEMGKREREFFEGAGLTCAPG
jgi:predicted unusual protein kinase regulating ubiquinone biosynthesis (AarF/ABC1/UbiB family)